MIKLNKKHFNGTSVLMDDNWLSNGRWLINRSLLSDNYLYNQGYFEHKMGQMFRVFEPDESGITPYEKAGLLEVKGVECNRTNFLAKNDSTLARLYKVNDGQVTTIQEIYDEAISGATFDKALYDNKMIKFITDGKVMAVVLIYQMELDLTVFQGASSPSTDVPVTDDDQDESPEADETEDVLEEEPDDEPEEHEDAFASQMQAILAS